MMILAALLLAQAASNEVVPTEAIQEDQEIVVMARRSGRWRGSWATENGQTVCKTERSSGDAKIDALGCANLVVCGPLHGPEMIALLRASQAAGAVRTREDARRIALPAMKKMEGCMRDKWRVGLRELRKQRRG